jgi:signal transduction histidine kinase
MSLRTKLVSFICLIVVSIIATLSWYFVNQQRASLSQSLLNTGTILVRNLAHNSRYSLIAEDRPTLQRLVDGALEIDEVVYVVMVGPERAPVLSRSKGTLVRGAIGRSPDKPLFPDPASAAALFEAPSGEPVLSSFTAVGGETIHDFALPLRRLARQERFGADLSARLPEAPQEAESAGTSAGKVLGVVRIGLTDATMQRSLRSIVWEVTLIAVLSIAVGIAATMLLTNRIIRPIRSLATMAHRVSEGDLSASVEPTTRDEVGELADVFNLMSRSLKDRETAITSAYRQLEQLTQTLEQRVRERTQELQCANEKLQELDRLKSAFVSIVSHELRTPMTSVNGYVNNMLTGLTGPLSEKQTHYLRRMQHNVERLIRLINDLLDLSRIEAGRIELHLATLSLTDVVAEAVEGLQSMAYDKSVTLVVQAGQEPSAVRGDRDKLHQVLTNLVHNAIKFTPAGGTVLVETKRSDDCWLVSVVDTGCGVASEELDRIFERFYRCESTGPGVRGAGLGLAITKSFVELHGGRIWAESTPGHGSRFSFTLPLPSPAT